MPLKPSRPCRHPNCPGITRESNGYCSKHQDYALQLQQEKVKAYDFKRGSSSSRGYDSRWRKLRIKVKDRDKWLCVCSRCKAMGRVTPLTKSDPVHHVLSVETHPQLRLRKDNCESQSFHCHEVEEGRAIDSEYESWCSSTQGGVQSLQHENPRPYGQFSVSFPI